MSDRQNRIDLLHRNRPRNPLLKWSLIALGVLCVYAWFSDEIGVTSLFQERRIENLRRFLTVEVVPFPLRGEPFAWGVTLRWVGEVFRERGGPGLLATLNISVVAVVLAGLLGLLLTLPAARNFMRRDPFLPVADHPDSVGGFAWRSLVHLTRTAHLLLRAIPEFIWAYLLLAMLGTSAWPAILALAIHNGGILGKLNAEVVENLDETPLRSLRSMGAGRMQIAAMGIFPTAISRWLLYFFYRFDSCVREATVLGMLGIVSLGYWISDARGKLYYDEMLLLIILGGGIVLMADLLSALARRVVRRAV